MYHNHALKSKQNPLISACCLPALHDIRHAADSSPAETHLDHPLFLYETVHNLYHQADQPGGNVEPGGNPEAMFILTLLISPDGSIIPLVKNQKYGFHVRRQRIMLTEFIVCFIAGLGAGLGTGFAGMSAAAVISPMLITFLHIPAYEAVGIALASDVLASAVSAYTYGRNKNLDIKNGLVMMISVLLFTLVGSWASSLLPNRTMGSFSVFMTLLLGIKFIIRPVMTTKESMAAVDPAKRVLQSVICGILVGFICGFVGAGGGMMMLLILTGVLGYELKTAVGTSVFIMAFTAFTGSVSHFAISGAPDLTVLVLCILSTLLWARIAARFANKASDIVLNRATGVVLAILGIAILAVR